MHRIVSVVSAAFAAAATGQPLGPFDVEETEPNDTVATATQLAAGRVFDYPNDRADGFDLEASRVTGSISPGDVDYFALSAVTSDRSRSVDLVGFDLTSDLATPIQFLVFDTITNEIISFITIGGGFDLEVSSFVDENAAILTLNRGPGTRRDLVFAVSAGLDIDPDLRDDLLGAIVDPSDLFDGLAFDTGLAHSSSFNYEFGFGLNLVPAPAGCAVLGIGALVAGRRRRSSR